MTSRSVEEPLGFPNCPKCPLVSTGAAGVCFTCASKTLPRSSGPHCRVCAQSLPATGICGNPVCSWPDRKVVRVAAIATYSSPLDLAIQRLKYDGGVGWAVIFGRVVHGWMALNLHPSDIDLVVPNPSWSGPEAPVRRHTELVIEAAARDDVMSRWPFDSAPWALTKPVDTPKSAGATWPEKRNAAIAHAAALVVDQSRVKDKRILLYDDVCTTLLTQEYLARRLLREGATSVTGLVLARTEYKR
jgi:predicted amidophosphoribosyltransferase